MSMNTEDTRFEVRRHLAANPASSLYIDDIAHRLGRKGLETNAADVLAACVFLAGLTPPQVILTSVSLGSGKRAQITSAGVLAYERNE